MKASLQILNCQQPNVICIEAICPYICGGVNINEAKQIIKSMKYSLKTESRRLINRLGSQKVVILDLPEYGLMSGKRGYLKYTVMFRNESGETNLKFLFGHLKDIGYGIISEIIYQCDRLGLEIQQPIKRGKNGEVL